MAKRLLLGVLSLTLTALGMQPAQAVATSPTDQITIMGDGAQLLGGAARTGGVVVSDDLLTEAASRVSGSATLTDGSSFTIGWSGSAGRIHAARGGLTVDAVIAGGLTRKADDVVEWSGPALVRGALKTVKVTITDRQADPGWHLVTLRHAGQDRTAFVRVPPHRTTEPTPVVFHFPGLLENAAAAETFETPSTSADRHGYLLVVPEHYGFGWQGVPAGTPTPPDVDDPGYVRALAAAVQQRFGGDPARTYASGMSNGGFFTSLAACRLTDVFAAFAPVSGQLTLTDCNPGRPVPIVMMHGDADPIVAYSGVATALPVWLKNNHCGSTPDDETLPDLDPSDGTRVIRHVYPCPASAPVVLYQIQNGGHAWPGGTPYPVDLGATTQDIDANEVIWSFVSPFHLPT